MGGGSGRGRGEGGGEEATKMWAIASVLLEEIHLRTQLVAATAARYQVRLSGTLTLTLANTN